MNLKTALAWFTIAVVPACSSGDDGSPLAEPAGTATVPATTPASLAPTTTAGPVATTVPTTIATTTTIDPLAAALIAEGFEAPATATRDAIQTYCDGFSSRDSEAINSAAAGDADLKDLLSAGFSVLCPENAALLGNAVMPNGDAVFAGYPVIVDVGTIDSRVANWFEGKLVGGQVVALAPGVYTPFNPNVPSLFDYLDGPNDGDCAMRDAFFPGTGGSCWSGVQKGTAEP